MKAITNLTNILALMSCTEAFVANNTPNIKHSVRLRNVAMSDNAANDVDNDKVCLITGASRGIGKWYVYMLFLTNRLYCSYMLI